MAKKILITGFSGVGKSQVAAKLRELGYHAHDLDDVPGLYMAMHKGTGKTLEHWDTADLDTVKNFQWLCDKEKLRTIVEREQADISFYCGSATNILELLDLFDTTILLVASHDVIRERLTTRTSNDWGKTKEVQEHILQNKDAEDAALKSAGAIVINADQPLAAVIKEILLIS